MNSPTFSDLRHRPENLDQHRDSLAQPALTVFEPPQGLLRQRRVEVVRDRELPGAKAEWSRAGLGRGDGPQLSYGAPIAGHDEALPGLNPVQESIQVVSEIL